MVIRLKDFARHGVRIESTYQPDPKEEIAYDLHVGGSYREPGNANRREMPEVMTLRANDCIRIDTEEKLRTPLGVFGQTCSRASLTAEGLVVANLKIDPNFQGHLSVTAFNTSTRPMRINRGGSFCSVVFFTLEEPLGPDAPVRVPPEGGILTRGLVEQMLIRAVPFILTFGASVVASVAGNYIFRVAR